MSSRAGRTIVSSISHIRPLGIKCAKEPEKLCYLPRLPLHYLPSSFSVFLISKKYLNLWLLFEQCTCDYVIKKLISNYWIFFFSFCLLFFKLFCYPGSFFVCQLYILLFRFQLAVLCSFLKQIFWTYCCSLKNNAAKVFLTFSVLFRSCANLYKSNLKCCCI